MDAPTHPLQIPDYRRFWAARFASVIATIGMVVVLGYQLYDLARSDYGMSIGEAAFQLGLLGLAQFVPLFLLTPVAGVVADRFDRRLVGALSMSIDLVVALSLAVATTFDLLTLPLLFLMAALHGAARVFVGPAIGSIAPNIVPAALLPKAVALNSMAMQGGMILGPAIGGLLYAQGTSLPYWSAAGLLTLGTAAILSIRRLPPPESNRAVHPFRQAFQGATFVWRERFLLGCMTLDLFAVLLAGATALLPVFARDILQVGPEGLGQMRAAPAVGAGIVAFALSIRAIERNVGVKMLWAVAAFGAVTIAFAFSRNYLLSLALLTLLGASDMISMYVRGTLVQLNTPDEMRGRVSAISGLAISASNELGEMQSGVAAALLGVTGAVVFGGAGAIVITLAWAFLFPELRNARTFAPQYRVKEHST